MDINNLPKELLELILQPFQKNEESFLVGIFCKKFNSIIQRDKEISITEVFLHYVESNQFATLQYLW